MPANKALLLHAFRERISNLNRLLLAIGVFVMSPIVWVFSGSRVDLPGEGVSMILALIFGAGVIGSDMSTGVIHLVLVRPVTRSFYVIAKWFAAGGLAAGIAVVQTILAVMWNEMHGGAVPLMDIVSVVLLQVSTAFGLAAVLTVLSVIAEGLGNLRIWILTVILGEVVGSLGGFRNWAWAQRMAKEISNLLLPKIDLSMMVGYSPFPWIYLVAFVSTVTLSLAVAIHLFNRKEMTYGAG